MFLTSSAIFFWQIDSSAIVEMEVMSGDDSDYETNFSQGKCVLIYLELLLFSVTVRMISEMVNIIDLIL